MVVATFESDSEALHGQFRSMTSDNSCVGCSSAGWGEALFSAWLQTTWATFTRELVIASAQGTRLRQGNSVLPVPGVKSRADAEKIVTAASRCTFKKRGLSYPVWHSPDFAIEVGNRVKLRNLATLEVNLGSSVVPRQITDFRNYLVHPSESNRSKYEEMREKLGFVRAEPEDLLRQQLQPNEMVFSYWVNELQRVANASTE